MATPSTSSAMRPAGGKGAKGGSKGGKGGKAGKAEEPKKEEPAARGPQIKVHNFTSKAVAPGFSWAAMAGRPAAAAPAPAAAAPAAAAEPVVEERREESNSIGGEAEWEGMNAQSDPAPVEEAAPAPAPAPVPAAAPKAAKAAPKKSAHELAYEAADAFAADVPEDAFQLSGDALDYSSQADAVVLPEEVELLTNVTFSGVPPPKPAAPVVEAPKQPIDWTDDCLEEPEQPTVEAQPSASKPVAAVAPAPAAAAAHSAAMPAAAAAAPVAAAPQATLNRSGWGGAKSTDAPAAAPVAAPATYRTSGSRFQGKKPNSFHQGRPGANGVTSGKGAAGAHGGKGSRGGFGQAQQPAPAPAAGAMPPAAAAAAPTTTAAPSQVAPPQGGKGAAAAASTAQYAQYGTPFMQYPASYGYGYGAPRTWQPSPQAYWQAYPNYHAGYYPAYGMQYSGFGGQGREDAYYQMGYQGYGQAQGGAKKN